MTQWIQSQLEGRFRLTIHREKTRLVNLNEPGATLDFLGFTFRYDRERHGGRHRYLSVFPSKKSVARLRERVRGLTGPRQCWKPAPEVIGEINRYLRGWGQYFQHGYRSWTYHHAHRFVQQRVIRHLQSQPASTSPSLGSNLVRPPAVARTVPSDGP